LKKDKSYRRYAAGVERALSLFDTALQEWADYISFLGRLLKVGIYFGSGVKLALIKLMYRLFKRIQLAWQWFLTKPP